MIIRVRSKVGTWRFEVQPRTTVSEVMARIEHEHSVKVSLQKLSFPTSKDCVSGNPTTRIGDMGMKHGDMMFLDFSGELVPAPTSVGAKKSIDANGNLVASSKSDDASFRPGVMSLRSQKLHWTLTDMVELDTQYTFDIKQEKQGYCHRVTLDGTSCDVFQAYLRNFAFQTARFGYLYGEYVDVEELDEQLEVERTGGSAKATSKPKSKPAAPSGKYGSTKANMKLSDLGGPIPPPKRGARVDAIYEPAQRVLEGNVGCELLEDAREGRADAVARSLGLRRVGCVISHPPRAKCVMSTHEVLMAGLANLEANDGNRESPFVVVLVTADESGNADFQAYQLTPQCLEMVGEDALVVMPDQPGISAVHETFTAIVEAKAAPVIDNDFFIKRVPIVSHTSPIGGRFPRFNREADVAPSQAAFTSAVKKAGRNPSDEGLCKVLADFHLLMFVGEGLLEMGEGLEQVSACVASHVFAGRERIPLEEGYKLMLCSIAGLD